MSIIDESLAAIAERNAKNLARLKWENRILKIILEAGHPLTVEFADRKQQDGTRI